MSQVRLLSFSGVPHWSVTDTLHWAALEPNSFVQRRPWSEEVQIGRANFSKHPSALPEMTHQIATLDKRRWKVRS